HPVVGRHLLAADQLALVAVPAEDRRPATRPRIAGAGPVTPHVHPIPQTGQSTMSPAMTPGRPLALAVLGHGVVDSEQPHLFADDEAVLRGRARLQNVRI